MRLKKKWNILLAMIVVMAIIFGDISVFQVMGQTSITDIQGYLSNPGGRLHEDFDGKNKAVYVENFTDNANGEEIYARIRLREYMEVGEGAGVTQVQNDTQNRKVKILGKSTANISDPTTWMIHKYGVRLTEDEKELYNYWKLEWGGDTIYMPTFNKDKDSIKVDNNGTIYNKYKDYIKYREGETKTALTTQDEKNGIVQEETHIATKTEQSVVISMETWKKQGCKSGAYWVYDVDGWAYWAKPILPGKATGLFLKGIYRKKRPNNKWYYITAIEGQFASSNGWGNADERNGFYRDGFTDDGKLVLDTAVKSLELDDELGEDSGGGNNTGSNPSNPNLPEDSSSKKVIRVQMEGDYKQYVPVGEEKQLKATVELENGTGDPKEQEVIWTCSSEDGTMVLEKPIFNPDITMLGKTYMITATSVVDPTKSANMLYFIYRSENGVKGTTNGKVYVDFGDNTFKEILDSGELGDFVCAGQDQKIGNSDDREDVISIDIDPESVEYKKYGNKFLGPDSDGVYLAKGADGKLGTADDIRVVGVLQDNPSGEITDELVDAVEVRTKNNVREVSVGGSLQLEAIVKKNGKQVSANLSRVNWTIIGNRSSKTTIDDTGKLNVDANETSSSLTIKATTIEKKYVSHSISITVKPDLSQLPNGVIKYSPTVRIDGIDWYVLVKDGSRVLLLAKDSVAYMAMREVGTMYAWGESDIYKYLNSSDKGGFLYAKPTLRNKVQQVIIKEHKAYFGTREQTNNKVFLLSEADVFGTVYGGNTINYKPEFDDFTYNGKRLITYDNSWVKPKRAYLRSLFGRDLVGIKQDGSLDTGYRQFHKAEIYPALWIDIRDIP